ncbi:MAG: putative ATPase [Pseudohongiellaceae bacterium]|jgi:putative ATPase
MGKTQPSTAQGNDGLFAAAGRQRAARWAPLAERMRPRCLDDFADPSGLLAPGAPLRHEIDQGRLSSLLLWGPPGCGKTTLARLLATATDHELICLSAVSTGVAALREALASAEFRLGAGGRPTLLFVDEIHRFHKGQQDALLHEAEDGRVVLVGATTENPSFHVNAALLSRCRLVRLPGLSDAAARQLAERALTDTEVGLKRDTTDWPEESWDALIALAGQDGRRLLNVLERAMGLASDGGRDVPTPEDLAKAAGERSLAHDKSGDAHYDLLSALHKSLRGSDPDAAVYYIQRILIAGDDPRVIARRLVRMASEDVGLADPRALSYALDALRAVEFLGLPEGEGALAQAAIYLALAPKSDAVTQACAAARAAVKQRGALPVPDALRNAPTALAKSLGHGEAYVNPHGVGGSVTGLEHLPDALAGSVFYRPSPRGAEPELGRRLAEFRRRRRVQPPRKEDPSDKPE